MTSEGGQWGSKEQGNSGGGGGVMMKKRVGAERLLGGKNQSSDGLDRVEQSGGKVTLKSPGSCYRVNGGYSH